MGNSQTNTWISPFIGIAENVPAAKTYSITHHDDPIIYILAEKNVRDHMTLLENIQSVYQIPPLTTIQQSERLYNT